jgi:hypothetical protein
MCVCVCVCVYRELSVYHTELEVEPVASLHHRDVFAVKLPDMCEGRRRTGALWASCQEVESALRAYGEDVVRRRQRAIRSAVCVCVCVCVCFVCVCVCVCVCVASDT